MITQLDKSIPSIDNFLRKVGFWLTFFLFLKILGFFTISENINITRALKVVVRFGTSGGIILLYIWVVSKGFVAAFNFRNLLAPFFYLMYLFLGLASLFWSSGFGYSLLQLFMTFETIPFVCLHLSIIQMVNKHFPETPLRLSNQLGKACFWVLAIFVAGMYINPDQFFRMTHGGEVARLGGFMMNPNELGMLAVVGMAACMLEIVYKHHRLRNLFMMGILLYGLLMTSSRSSLGSFLLVLLFFVFKEGNFKLKFAIVAGVVLCMPLAVQTIILKQGDLQEVLSMTGRLPFWKALLTEGLPKEPWLGYGFMRISYTDYFQSVHTYAAKMTHNTFVQVLMNLGFVGFAITLAQMAATYRAYWISSDKYKNLFFMGILIPIVINSFTEFGIFGENNFGILFYQYLIFWFVIEASQQLDFKQKYIQKRLRRNYEL